MRADVRRDFTQLSNTRDLNGRSTSLSLPASQSICGCPTFYLSLALSQSSLSLFSLLVSLSPCLSVYLWVSDILSVFSSLAIPPSPSLSLSLSLSLFLSLPLFIHPLLLFPSPSFLLLFFSLNVY